MQTFWISFLFPQTFSVSFISNKHNPVTLYKNPWFHHPCSILIYVHITCIYRYIRLLVNLPRLLPDPNLKLNQLTVSSFFFQRKRRSWERRCYRSSPCVGSSSSSSSCSSTCVVCSTSARSPGELLSPPSPQVGHESPGGHELLTPSQGRTYSPACIPMRWSTLDLHFRGFCLGLICFFLSFFLGGGLLTQFDVLKV